MPNPMVMMTFMMEISHTLVTNSKRDCFNVLLYPGANQGLNQTYFIMSSGH